MNGMPFRKRGGRFQWWVAGAVFLTAAWSPDVVRSQSSEPSKLAISEPATPPGQPPAAPATTDSGVVRAGGPTASEGGIQQTSCSSCGAGLLGTPEPANLCVGCGGHSPCVPGRRPCDCCCDEHGGACKCFFCGLYHCMCCPDPCYEPRWLAVADAAFFQDAARPVTQMRLRWDTAWGLKDPDRAEFFWARDKTNPNQLEPGGPCARHGFGKGPACIASQVDYEDLSLYMEAAAGAAGLFIEMPYRHIDPTTAPASAVIKGMPDPATGMTGPAVCCPEAGFADMNIGTKAMLLDCELIQITFQFKTYIPTGNFTKGLGTGHVSLEPSLIFGIKLSPTAHLQIQQAYWIPIGGDPLYQANVYHGHIALNKILWCPCRDFKIVGTMELNGWQIFGGAFTDPDLVLANPMNGTLSPVSHSASTVMLNTGPGVRMVICDRIDLGVGSAFAITGSRWAAETVRVEFRWRF